MVLFLLICVAVSFTHIHCQSNYTFVTPGRGKSRLHIVRFSIQDTPTYELLALSIFVPELQLRRPVSTVHPLHYVCFLCVCRSVEQHCRPSWSMRDSSTSQSSTDWARPSTNSLDSSLHQTHNNTKDHLKFMLKAIQQQGCVNNYRIL